VSPHRTASRRSSSKDILAAARHHIPSTNATKSDCSGVLTVASRSHSAQRMAASWECVSSDRACSPDGRGALFCSLVSPDASVIAEVSFISIRLSSYDDQADFRCAFVEDFFGAASLAGFLTAIGISISFCPADAFLNFFAGFSTAFDIVDLPPTLSRNASIRSTTLSPRGRSRNGHFQRTSGGRVHQTVTMERGRPWILSGSLRLSAGKCPGPITFAAVKRVRTTANLGRPPWGSIPRLMEHQRLPLLI
jgi:hypothetical protein